MSLRPEAVSTKWTFIESTGNVYAVASASCFGKYKPFDHVALLPFSLIGLLFAHLFLLSGMVAP
jgi:hypothetical protein